jgi:hypothetical protein
MQDDDVKKLTQRYRKALDDQNRKIDRLAKGGRPGRRGKTSQELLRDAYESPEHRDPAATRERRVKRRASKRSKGRSDGRRHT